MEENKKIKKLLDKKAKVNDDVKRMHNLLFEESKSDNVETRILWREYDKAKKQLVAINERIEQLRRKCEAKVLKSKGVTPKSIVEETATEKGKTVVEKEDTGTQEIIRLVGNTGASVNKKVKSQAKPVQPSAKPKGNNNLEKATKVVKPKDEGEDKKTENENEGKKPKEDIKTQPELNNNSEKEKPKRVQERVKIKGIDIRVRPQIEPRPIIPTKPIIPSERLR